jgi:hypothetical protein
MTEEALLIAGNARVARAKEQNGGSLLHKGVAKESGVPRVSVGNGRKGLNLLNVHGVHHLRASDPAKVNSQHSLNIRTLKEPSLGDIA